MAGNTMELDDGWAITLWDGFDTQGPEVAFHNLSHSCYINTVRSPVVPLATGKLICLACKRKVPDEVLGFYNLCKWRQ